MKEDIKINENLPAECIDNEECAEAKETRSYKFQRTLPQVLVAMAKNLVTMNCGIGVAFITILIPQVIESNTNPNIDLRLNKEQISWLGSLCFFCMPVSCLFSGIVTQPFGRRRSIMCIVLLHIVAWCVLHTASNALMLYAFTAIIGIQSGLVEAPVMTYVAETAEPHVRGVLTSMGTMFNLFGALLQYILGSYIPWRKLALINIVFPIMAIACIYMVPETPHWLLSCGQIKEAEASLCWLRGWVQPSEVQQELNLLLKSISEGKARTLSVTQKKRPWLQPYLRRSFFYPFCITWAVFTIGYTSGMFSIPTYAISIISSLGVKDTRLPTILLGVAQFFGTVTCSSLIHYTGKRILNITSLTLYSLALAILSLYCHNQQENVVNSWCAVSLLIGAIYVLYTSIRILPWLLVGEVFPLEVRGTASGFAAAVGTVMAFLVNKSYLSTLDCLGLDGTLAIYSFCALTGAAFLYFLLPETEGCTLAEIEHHFDKGSSLIPCRNKNIMV